MTYEELITATLSYVDRRDDSDLIGSFPTFFLMAESKMNRFLYVRDMELAYDFTATEGQYVFTLPTDHLGLRNIKTDKAVLELMTPEQFTNIGFNAATLPCYVFEGNTVKVNPALTAGQVLTINYYRKVPALSAGLNNWLSIANPDCYICGLMAEVSIFGKDYNAYGAWKERFDTALNEIEGLDTRVNWSGPPLVQKVG